MMELELAQASEIQRTLPPPEAPVYDGYRPFWFRTCPVGQWVETTTISCLMKMAVWRSLWVMYPARVCRLH